MEVNMIELYEKTIPAENHNNIPITFFCDYFDIDESKMLKLIEIDKLYKDNFSLLIDEDLFDDKKAHLYLNKKSFIRWILQLHIENTNDNQRELFIEYQINIVDYLFNNANQQEAILKKGEALKKRRKEIYLVLASERDDFVEYMNLGAEIARLGNDNKIIQKKIASNQFTLELE